MADGNARGRAAKTTRKLAKTAPNPFVRRAAQRAIRGASATVARAAAKGRQKATKRRG